MSPVATVVILTYNGAEYIDACLSAIEAQKAPFDFCILAIDSGSTDGTVDILRRHTRVQLYQIPNEDFGHGRTRNLGASMVTGEFAVFLVQDAVPASEHWLARMVEPFALNDRIGCVYGRQIPRPDCCGAVKYDVRSFFRAVGDTTSLRLDACTTGDGPPADEGRTRYFSDVNSAVRITAWREVPFRDVAFAEDQALARDLLNHGWLKAYTPFGAVYHSHDLRLRPYYTRMYDEWTALRAIGVEPYRGLLRLFIGTGRLAGRNAFEAAMDQDYRYRRRLAEILMAPAYSAARHLAMITSRRSRER